MTKFADVERAAKQFVTKAHTDADYVAVASQLVTDLLDIGHLPNTAAIHLCAPFRAGHVWEKAGYITFDPTHRLAIARAETTILAYQEDPTLYRPLTLVLSAASGSGKSFFVESLAKGIGALNDNYVPVNMANLHHASDLVPAIDAVRNFRVRDKLPLLFLDEFDSRNENIASLLPLLWDGELSVGGRTLRLGRTVIVIAGSNREITDALANPNPAACDGVSIPKLRDLRSRINAGCISIPDLNGTSATQRASRVCLLMALLWLRTRKKLTEFPFALLSFIDNVAFQDKARSVASFVDALPGIWADATAVPFADINAFLRDEEAILHRGLTGHIDVGGVAKIIVNSWDASANRAPGLMVTFGDGKCVWR